MSKKKILLIGGGGHCKSVLDSLYSKNYYDDIGIIDQKTDTDMVLKAPIIGTDEDLPVLFREGFREAFITIGSIGDPSLRKKLFKKICDIGFDIPNIIDITASVSRNIRLGRGIFIGKKAVINAGAVIGNVSIINTGGIIEHDCQIGDFVHVAPGTTVCGNVTIGNDSHIGAGSTIIQGIQISKEVIIGAGSVVVNPIMDSGKYYGIPAKKMDIKL